MPSVPAHIERPAPAAGSAASLQVWPDALLLAAFLSSGIAALGLELIWVRVLGLAFGSESFGMLGVLAAFFAGLALGSAALHRAVMRSVRPARLYIAAECVVAAYALLATRYLLRLPDALPRLLGSLVGDNRSLPALTVNLVVATVLLLPATICMGATTVAIVEAWRRRRTAAQNATTVAWLYASNTFGATLGIVVAMYWLLPSVGIQAASGVLAAFSLAAAGLAWHWDRTVAASASGFEAPSVVDSGFIAAPKFVYGLLFLTGLAGIGIETVGTQVLSQILENTVYTFANILAVYLLGTALGAWIFTWAPLRRLAADRDRCTSVLLYALAVAGIFAAAVLTRAPEIIAALVPSTASYSARLTAQTAMIALMFLPATVCMGATFSHLLTYFTDSGVGYGMAFNTVGATLAPFLFGLVLIPSAGYGVAFYAAVSIYLAIFVAAHLWHRQPARWALVGGCLAAAAVAYTFSPLILVRFGPNVDILEQRTGLYGVVTVADTANATPGAFRPRILVVDQSYQMGGSPGGVEKRMGHLPMLMARAPRNVLFLGVGTGITAGAALGYPVERVTAVDLLPEVIDVLPWFGDFNGRLRRDARASLHASDARRFIGASGETYDAIVADLYHPSRDGTAVLYTREHFLAIRSRLRPGGLFMQWLPIYQMRADDLRTIVRTFLDVFPDAHSAMASYSVRAAFGLIGFVPGPDGQHGVDVARAQALLGSHKGAGEVFEGLADVLGSYMLDAGALREYAGPGPINTDNNQRIAFDAAPAARIAEGNQFHKTLASLVPYRRQFADGFVTTRDAAALAALRQQVGPYDRAATHYLNAEIRLRDSQGDGIPPEALAEYLAGYREDAAFTSSRARLLALALQYPNSAKDIVDRLWAARPDQADIRRLKERLDAVHDADGIRLAVIRFLQSNGGR